MISWIRNFFHSDKEYYQDYYDEHFCLAGEIEDLKEKYDSLLLDIKMLEEADIEQTNALYEISNSLDARIDIIYNELKGLNGDGI
jgi:hypothetical protein